MNQSSLLSPANFVTQFERFRRFALEQSNRPFTTFQSGLPYEWEHYKECVFHEAIRRLDIGSWKPSQIGSGEILQHVLDAITIRENKDCWNNLVQWDGRRGPDHDSHKKMLDAQKDPGATMDAETALDAMYTEEIDPATCF